MKPPWFGCAAVRNDFACRSLCSCAQRVAIVATRRPSQQPATTFCLNRIGNSRQNHSGSGDMGVIAGRLWARLFALAALSMGGLAEGHRSERAPATPPTTLTGDWGGLRSYLDRNGVTITLNYTNDFLANVRGGIGPGAVGIGIFQPQLDLDLQKLIGWDGGKFHTPGLITHSPSFTATYLRNILPASHLEAGPVARLYSFWYEQNFNSRLSVRAGLMSADSQFLQSRTAANFINNGISWPTFLAANLPAGGPAYPLPAPGVRVRF